MNLGGLIMLAALGCAAPARPVDTGTSSATDSAIDPFATSSGTTTTTGSGSDSTTAPAPTPGAACPDPQPVDVPVPAIGCEHIFLRDDDGEPTETPSGFVACGPQPVVYRIAAVPCPLRPDSVCLCDADCGEGKICGCGAGVLGCVPADCRTSDDCGDGHCKVADDDCLSPRWMLCTTPSDDCVAHQDCSRTGYCGYDETQEFFTCEPGAICE